MAKKAKNLKKSSLSKRVTISVIVLGFVSIMGILLNANALILIQDYTSYFNPYLQAQEIDKLISASYVEVELYSTTGATAQVSEEANKLKAYSEELKSVGKSYMNITNEQPDDELITLCSNYADAVAAYADGALASGKISADSKQSLLEAKSAYDELIAVRIPRLEGKTKTKVNGTIIFDNALVGLNFIILVEIIITLYLKLVKPAKSSKEKTINIIDKIKSGNGDLTERLEIKANDEVGALATGINEVMGELHDIMSTLNGHAESLKTISETVTDNVRKSQDEVTNVTSIMEEMSATSEETSASLSQVANQIDSITALINGVYENANEQASETTKIMDKVDNMRRTAIEERDISDASTEQLVQALEVSIDSARKVEEINTLVDDILSISSQTNMLSLNASIEAARAGEAGKGFAVVAEQISKLAKDTSEAANHIQEVSSVVIGAVNELASKAKEMSESMISANVEGRESVISMTDNYISDVDIMAQSMNHFAESSQQIQEFIVSIQEAIDGINHAAEEQAAGITNITTSTIDISQAMVELENEAERNSDVSEALFNEVSKFKL